MMMKPTARMLVIVVVFSAQLLPRFLSSNVIIGTAFAFAPLPPKNAFRLFPSHPALLRTKPIGLRRDLSHRDYDQYGDDDNVNDSNDYSNSTNSTEYNEYYEAGNTSKDLYDYSSQEEEFEVLVGWDKVPRCAGGIRQYAMALVVGALWNGDATPTIDAVEREAFQEALKVNKIHPDTLPLEVSEALFCYFVTGNVDDVRKICKDTNKLRLFVREFPEEDRGALCVLQYKDMKREKVGRTRPVVIEYYATPIFDANAFPFSIVEMNRPEIPFNSAKLAIMSANQAIILDAALIGSIVFRVPISGLMPRWGPRALFTSTSLLLSRTGLFLSRVCDAMMKPFFYMLDRYYFTIVPVAIVSAVFLFLIVAILVDIVTGSFTDKMEEEAEEELDVDWLQKQPRATISAVSMILNLVGTKVEASPVRPFLVSSLLGVVPGMSEELLFRGVVQTALTRSLGIFPAVVIQAGLFGLAHRGYRSKLYMLLTSIFGFLLGQAYALSGNLALPMLLHAGYNFINSLIAQKLLESMTGFEIRSLIAFASPKHFRKKPQEGTTN